MFQFIKKLFQFLYWTIKDIRNHKMTSPYGVVMYCGLPGRGKTISVVEYLERIRARYPEDKRPLIYTNFHYIHENGQITHWRDLVDIQHENGVIFAIDEVQLTFQSREFKNFPPEMITLLTQNRKMRKQVVCTAQSFNRVDKVFRELTNYVVECRTLGTRWTFQRAFETCDYMDGLDPQFGKRRARAWRYSFVQTDDIRNLYDTMLQLDSLKNTEYERQAVGSENQVVVINPKKR